MNIKEWLEKDKPSNQTVGIEREFILEEGLSLKDAAKGATCLIELAVENYFESREYEYSSFEGTQPELFGFHVFTHNNHFFSLRILNFDTILVGALIKVK